MSDHDPRTRVVERPVHHVRRRTAPRGHRPAAGTVQIVETGAVVNGFGPAVEALRELLVGRVHRFLPLMTVFEVVEGGG